MNEELRKNASSTRKISVGIFLTISLLCAGTTLSPAHSADRQSYIPGISLVPEVLEADGVTDRTYNTPQGPTLWTNGLPIQQGDKIKLNVFAATGGSELQEIKIRLDNVKIADIAAAPWHTVLNTATLQPGYHMVEVWALASGNKPQSTTRTLSFFIAHQMDAKYLVQGTQQILTNNAVTNVPLEGGADTGDTAPLLPDFLKDQPTDAAATVMISARSAASANEAGGAAVTGGAATINEPTLFAVQPAPGSTATQFAYALVRDGGTFNASTKPLPTNYSSDTHSEADR